MNPKNTNLKLGILVITIIVMIFNGVGNFEFSWDMVISFGVFIISMTCHEVAHGYVAYKFGDDTAKNQGRITLNPIKHIDITGLLLPVLLLLSGASKTWAFLCSNSWNSSEFNNGNICINIY